MRILEPEDFRWGTYRAEIAKGTHYTEAIKAANNGKKLGILQEAIHKQIMRETKPQRDAEVAEAKTKSEAEWAEKKANIEAAEARRKGRKKDRWRRQMILRIQMMKVGLC